MFCACTEILFGVIVFPCLPLKQYAFEYIVFYTYRRYIVYLRTFRPVTSLNIGAGFKFFESNMLHLLNTGDQLLLCH